MVKKAPIKAKEAQFHNDSTLHCGFNKEVEQIEGDSWMRSC